MKNTISSTCWTISRLLLCLLITACQPKQEAIELNLISLFSDHMVLQQQEGAAIWGHYTPQQEVSISGSWGNEAKAIANEQGKWRANLPTPQAGGPYTLTITTPDSTLTLQDVMIGEVWLASGQSNMEMSLEGWPPNDPIQNSAEEIAQADYPGIRMFTVAKNFSLTPLDSVHGEWNAAYPAMAGNFSATAYFFARRLHQELGIPIGIVHTSWGGTVAEAWTSKQQLQTLGDFDEVIQTALNPTAQAEADAWFSPLTAHEIPNTEAEWGNIDLGDLAAAQTDYQDNA